MAKSRKRGLPPFDKYQLYLDSVQSPDADARFLSRIYQKLNPKRPDAHILREDFCAAFALSCAWVRRAKTNLAYSIDLDPEPLAYGRKNYLPLLSPHQAARVHTIRKNVLAPNLPKADIIAALNFSYFIIRERKTLLAYFKGCRSTLKRGGLLVIDVMGGSGVMLPNEEETAIEGKPLTYYWDQKTFNPINHHATFFIHYKRRGEKKRQRVFRYDWRLWSIPELTDIMTDAGFKKVHCFWEGTTEDGDGDGVFRLSTKGDACESFVAYLAAQL